MWEREWVARITNEIKSQMFIPELEILSTSVTPIHATIGDLLKHKQISGYSPRCRDYGCAPRWRRSARPGRPCPRAARTDGRGTYRECATLDCNKQTVDFDVDVFFGLLESHHPAPLLSLCVLLPTDCTLFKHTCPLLICSPLICNHFPPPAPHPQYVRWGVI